MALIDFLASSAGRWVRIAVGGVIFGIGLLALDGAAGTVVTVIGLIPMLAGMFDVCLLAPLLGAPLSGRKIRASQREPEEP